MTTHCAVNHGEMIPLMGDPDGWWVKGHVTAEEFCDAVNVWEGFRPSTEHMVHKYARWSIANGMEYDLELWPYTESGRGRFKVTFVPHPKPVSNPKPTNWETQ